MASSNGKKPGIIPLGERGCIEIRGARQNNLKGFDLDLPLGQLTVITGPSGSGKSSLAFDTIYAEGQRRYVETFSPYTRQFLERMDKPRVDEIRGIPPAIAIEQSNPVKSSRSTVGTMTEINDYLKLLMPRVARAFCPSCGREIRPETAKSIAEEVFRQFEGHSSASPGDDALRLDARKRVPPEGPASAGPGASVLITFWVAVPLKTEPRDFFGFLQQQGYLRVWLNGEVVRADGETKKLRLGARVQVIQDRLTITEENRARLVESIETALRFGKDKINFIDLATKEEHPFSTGWHCAHCDLDIRPPTPGLFSFNNPLGACPECRGFGRTIAIDLNRAIPDRALSIAQGAVRVFRGEEMGESQKDLLRACAREEIDVHLPFEELPKHDQDFVINGEKGAGEFTEEDCEGDRWYGVRGFFRWLESKTYKMHVRVLLSRYRAYTTCPSCQGGRFQPETLNYRLLRQDGIAFTLPEFAALPIAEARDFLTSLALPPNDSAAEMLRAEIGTRLGYLCEVGVGYLTLDRSTRTLSGGEVQRVNLTTCLGASLVNTLFVMDEPSVGLHPRDVGRLVRVMHNLRDKGNTLLVVEHEEAIIRAADHLLDIGPGRGERGGELVFQGTLAEFLGSARDPRAAVFTCDSPNTLAAEEKFATARVADRQHAGRVRSPAIPLDPDYLTGHESDSDSENSSRLLPRDQDQRRDSAQSQEPRCRDSVRRFHLRNRRLRLGQIDPHPRSPLPKSPPSTRDGERRSRRLQERDRRASRGRNRNGRSVAALPHPAFDSDSLPWDLRPGARAVRRLAGSDGTGSDRKRVFLQLRQRTLRALRRDRLRENRNAIPERPLRALRGMRRPTLPAACPESEARGHSIHELLEMTVSEAMHFFNELEESETLARPLAVLEEVGLGYLRLGQPLNTLSGGESQRLKLVRHLGQTGNGNGETGDLFIFDEPTTGLHFDDVALLIRLFQRLVEAGNSIVVIEHNLEVIKCADWIIDLGPEGGEEGGQLVAAGTPEDVAKVAASHTGQFLAQICWGAQATRVLFHDASRETSARYAILRRSRRANSRVPPKNPSASRPMEGRRGDRSPEISQPNATVPSPSMARASTTSRTSRSPSRATNWSSSPA